MIGSTGGLIRHSVRSHALGGGPQSALKRYYSSTSSDISDSKDEALVFIVKEMKTCVSESLRKEIFIDPNDVPSRESDVTKYIKDNIAKAPVFPRSILTVGFNLPLAQQKSYKRQLIKVLKHIWVLSHLQKFFSDTYGSELGIIINKCYEHVLQFPVDPLTTGVIEEDQDTISIREWYQQIVIVVGNVDRYCEDFPLMKVMRSILLGQWRETFQISQSLYRLGLTETDLQRVIIFDRFVDTVKKSWTDITSVKNFSKSISRQKYKKAEQSVYDIQKKLTHPLVVATQVTPDEYPLSIQVHLQAPLKNKESKEKKLIRQMYKEAVGYSLISSLKQLSSDKMLE